MIAIEPCTEESMRWVADHLSPADELEVTTVADGRTPHEALRWGHEVSSDSFAVHPVLGGKLEKPVALFGVVDDNERSPGYGVIWLLTTPMLMSTSRDILKEAPKWLSEWAVRFPNGLHNLVDLRNERHIRWLKKMGATFPNTGRMIRDVPFAYFHINRGMIQT